MLVILNPTMPLKFYNRLLVNFAIIFPTFEDIDSQARIFFSIILQVFILHGTTG